MQSSIDYADRPSLGRAMLDTEMIKTNTRRNSNVRRRKEPVVITVSIVVLGAAVLLCAALLVPPLWTALVEAWESSSTSQECGKLTDKNARRACVDTLDAGIARQPAKDGTAPSIRRFMR